MKKDKKPDLLQDETLAQKLITKGFWLYLFSYLIAPGGYLIRLMISNSPEVSVADVGILYSIIGLINFLNVYNDLGLTESLQYFLPKFWIKKEYNHIKTTIWLSMGIQIFSSFLIIGGLWRGADWLGTEYFHSEKASQILKYFCRYFLGINILQSLQSIFMAFQKTFDAQLVEFIKMWTTVGFTAFFFFFGDASIESFSLNWIFGLLVGLAVAGILYWRKYRYELMQGSFERDKPMLSEYSKYAIRAFVGANVGNLFGQVIQQMVIYFLGDEAAGYYANFLSLFLIGNILFGPIMSLIFPMVSEFLEKKNTEKLSLLLNFFYSYFVVFVLSFSILEMSIGPELAQALFGEKYIPSGELLSFSGIFLIFNIMAGFNFAILSGLGKVKTRVLIVGISTLITILFTSFALKVRGLSGSALGFGISYLILWGLGFIEVIKVTPFSFNWKIVGKNIILIGILGICLFAGKAYLPRSTDSRRELIGALFLIGIGYYIVWGLGNLSTLKNLRQELRTLYHSK